MDTLTLFSKNLNQRSLTPRWPLTHVCWGHMCDSTQGSLCPSPMTIHQCMWIQWSILQNTTYIHILHTYTYILHTTYRMSDHIVSYWTQFRQDKNGSARKAYSNLHYAVKKYSSLLKEKGEKKTSNKTVHFYLTSLSFCWAWALTVLGSFALGLACCWSAKATSYKKDISLQKNKYKIIWEKSWPHSL